MQKFENQISQIVAVVSRLDTNGKLPTQPEHQVNNVSVITVLGHFEYLYMMIEKEFDEVF